jgi:hypothetical protein
MRAQIKFTDDQEAIVDGVEHWDFRRLDNGDVWIQFTNDEALPIALFASSGVRSLDFDYDE